MKATISKGELKFALNAVCKTASNAAANLACVLIDARDAVMRFETNDGVCASMYESLALIDEPGRLLLPASYRRHRVHPVLRQVQRQDFRP